MSDDLAARVLAAIEAKEAKARAATPGPWTAGEPDGPGEAIVYGADWRIAEATLYPRSRAHSRFPKLRVPVHLIDANANAAHIVDNDPDDVLRRCAKDRKIVALTAVVDRDKHGNFLCRDPSDEALLDVLIALAEGYGIEVGT